MKDVYANSTCTVTAMWGNNSFTGCFVERDPALVMPCKIFLRWTGKAAEYNSPLLLAHDNTWRTFVNEGILNKKRGGLQERLLSPRVLHFTTEQLFWECKMLANEMFPALHAIDRRIGESWAPSRDQPPMSARLTSDEREQ